MGLRTGAEGAPGGEEYSSEIENIVAGPLRTERIQSSNHNEFRKTFSWSLRHASCV